MAVPPLAKQCQGPAKPGTWTDDPNSITQVLPKPRHHVFRTQELRLQCLWHLCFVQSIIALLFRGPKPKLVRKQIEEDKYHIYVLLVLAMCNCSELNTYCTTTRLCSRMQRALCGKVLLGHKQVPDKVL